LSLDADKIISGYLGFVAAREEEEGQHDDEDERLIQPGRSPNE